MLFRLVEHGAELCALLGNRAIVDVADVGDRRRHDEVADGVLAGELRFERRLEEGIALDIGARPALPAAAEAAHAMAEIKEKAFALLLAIVGDVDAGFRL